MKARRATMTERKRCSAAANLMLLLCLINVGPVLLLTAMGIAGAAVTYPERNFNSARAMVTGLLILGVPLCIAQVWVRRGRRGAIWFGILFELLLVGGMVYLAVSVLGSSFAPQFKLLAGVLSVVTLAAYGLGVFRLIGAAREAWQQQTSGRNSSGR